MKKRESGPTFATYLLDDHDLQYEGIMKRIRNAVLALRLR